MSVDYRQIHLIAERMLADYDAHRPNEVFAEHRIGWLTLDEAYAVQRAVAELRRARGERSIGYKVGCISNVIQEQLGLREPVRGYLWQSESLPSGTHVPYSCQPHPARRFVNSPSRGKLRCA